MYFISYISASTFQHHNVVVEVQFKNDFHGAALFNFVWRIYGIHIYRIPSPHWEVVFYTTSTEITQKKLCSSSDLLRVFLYSAFKPILVLPPFPSTKSFFGTALKATSKKHHEHA